MSVFESFFSMLGMIFIMGIFVSFVVLLGTLRAKEEAERRRAMRDAKRPSES